MSIEPSHRPPSSPDPEWLQLVRTQVESLRYGLVQLVVHDGKVTQIERTEKTRLSSQTGESARAV